MLTSLENIQGHNTALEARFADKLKVKHQLNRQLVSFQANKNKSVYRWFNYKQGFSGPGCKWAKARSQADYDSSRIRLDARHPIFRDSQTVRAGQPPPDRRTADCCLSCGQPGFRHTDPHQGYGQTRPRRRHDRLYVQLGIPELRSALAHKLARDNGTRAALSALCWSGSPARMAAWCSWS